MAYQNLLLRIQGLFPSGKIGSQPSEADYVFNQQRCVYIEQKKRNLCNDDVEEL